MASTDFVIEFHSQAGFVCQVDVTIFYLIESLKNTRFALNAAVRDSLLCLESRERESAPMIGKLIVR